jgi:hypothetical protein
MSFDLHILHKDALQTAALGWDNGEDWCTDLALDR